MVYARDCDHAHGAWIVRQSTHFLRQQKQFNVGLFFLRLSPKHDL